MSTTTQTQSTSFVFAKLFIKLVSHTFFREVTVDDHHLTLIPPDAGVLFVGNHQNQFMDALILMSHCPRPVGFLVAQKSMNGVIGFFARLFHSIPVARPQDTAKNGPGSIEVKAGSTQLKGTCTEFTKLDLSKHSICPKGSDPLRVKSIVSDTELVLHEPSKKDIENKPYKIYDKIDQNLIYTEVWKRLSQGACVGIFPEGGSHDRTELLPLKAGVTIMALGTIANFHRPVYIVPCGLNYFHGHRFRGSVLLEFGRPYKVPDSLATTYTTNQREACAKLLETIQKLMETVIIHAPDRETLETVYLVRKLYQPTNLQLTPEQYIELNHRFVTGFRKFRDDPRVAKLWEEVLAYKRELMSLGLRDGHIEESTAIGGFQAFWLVTLRFVLCFLTLILAFPGTVLNLPVMYTARKLAAKHQKEALAASEVKIQGLDVVASKKVTIGIVLFPPLYLFYTLLAWWFFGGSVAVATIFGLFILTGSAIRFGEESVAIARSLTAIFKMRWIGSKMKELSNTRKKLQSEIREIVKEVGPSIAEVKEEDEFGDWRIIKETQIDPTNAQGATFKPNITGRQQKPFITVNPWKEAVITDQEWKEIEEMQEIF